MKDAFAKKFLVPGEIPLAVLAFRYRLDSEQFRSAPRTCHGAGGRLRMRRADCEGGSPRVRYTTARFRHPAWLRRDGCVAARGARAAGGNATDHRVVWPEHGLGLEAVDRCFCAAAARTRLDRGPNLAIKYRWADARSERFAEIAAEFVRLKVDVIVTGGNAAVAAKQVSSVVPIVFALVDDPVSMGLAASLARPGGNITGLSIQATDLAGKRLELLREVVPGLHRLAIMANVDLPSAEMEMGGIQTAARTLGLEVVPAEIRRAEDIAPAFEGLKSRADALYVVGDALVITHRIRINTLALAARLPAIYYFREYVEVGGLMSYGPNIPDLFRRAADYVDKILRGAKPGELPVEQATRFDLVINLTTASRPSMRAVAWASPSPTRRRDCPH